MLSGCTARRPALHIPTFGGWVNLFSIGFPLGRDPTGVAGVSWFIGPQLLWVKAGPLSSFSGLVDI